MRFIGLALDKISRMKKIPTSQRYGLKSFKHDVVLFSFATIIKKMKKKKVFLNHKQKSVNNIFFTHEKVP